MLLLIFVSRTHEGRINQINEDRLLLRSLSGGRTLLLVADGLGGHPGGHVASSLVSKYLSEQPEDKLAGNLVDLLIQSSTVIARHGSAHPIIDGMGSTATLVLTSRSCVQWAHVGDCRLYHLNGTELKCKTRDQTLARQMFDLGEIEFDEIRSHKLSHVLEQCLGEDDIEPDWGEFSWSPGDILLLNTDGLTSMLPDEQIQAVISEQISLSEIADNLLEKALQAGGKDNISFILGLHDNN